MARTKTVKIKLRVDPEAKEQAESLYNGLGMSLDEAVNVFLHKSVMEKGIPFEVQQSYNNAATEFSAANAQGGMDAASAAADTATGAAADAAAGAAAGAADAAAGAAPGTPNQ